MEHTLIHIAIADDHRTIRQALKSSLSHQRQFHFVFEAENGEDLLNKLSRQQAHVILLDIQMPVMNGIEALKTIQEKYPQIRVLILTAFLDEFYVAECLKYGVNGYLTKSMEIEEIAKAIYLAYNNEVYFSNLMNNAILKDYVVKHQKSQTCLPDFTMDEVKILDLLKDEMSTGEISDIMNLSRRSIEIKRDKMRQKVNVKTIGGLLLYAYKRGLIQ